MKKQALKMEAVVSYLKLTAQHLRGKTDNNHRKYQVRLAINKAKFQNEYLSNTTPEHRDNNHMFHSSALNKFLT
jgi:hypothetical protein